MPTQNIQSIISSGSLRKELPITTEQEANVQLWRHIISSMIHGRDSRLLVIVGPCSIHDITSAREYAGYVQGWREEFGDTLEVVMRTYWEKPRTTIGWKGLINDPHLDGTYDIESGLRIARKLLLDLVNMGVPTATEFLEPLSVGYISDLISWGAIGARTTESQTHRELASGLSCPVGFKNGTDGSIKIATDAMQSAGYEHTILSVGDEGIVGIIKTSGNPDTHIILRGSNKGTNFDRDSISDASELARKYGLPSRVMIDVSHQNSQKDHKRQMEGIDCVVEQIDAGSKNILGVMIESNINEGSQTYIPGTDSRESLLYGTSITDACVGIPATYEMLQKLANSRSGNK